MMNFSSKIDEWIAEAETRPGSALMILKLVANRLRDLSERNEALLAENLALQDGSRVQEYERRIEHLEYQLAMLKRQVSAEAGAAPAESVARTAVLLVYNALGRVLRLDVNPETPPLVGLVRGDLAHNGDFPRILAAQPQDDLLFLFSNGRIQTLPLAQIPVAAGQAWDFASAPLPEEPHAGETLVALLPLRQLPFATFFAQVSRRGCLKKTPVSLSQSIFTNRYLGRGAVQKSDKAFDLLLCNKGERLGVISYEGRALAMLADDLPFSAEETLRLSATDFTQAFFSYTPSQTLLFFTQNGKVLQREAPALELFKSAGSRGQGLISAPRLQQGVRFVGAAAASAGDAIVALSAEGHLTLHSAEQAAAEGALHPAASILSIGILPGWGAKESSQ